MTTTTKTKPWDFSHALELANALSPKAVAAETTMKPNNDTSSDLNANITDPRALSVDARSSGLGDFSRVWQYLGTPSAAPVVPAGSSGQEATYVPNKLDYTSDGAAYTTQRLRRIYGRNPAYTTDGEDTTLNGAGKSTAESDTPTALTKTQRKKVRRKERKAREKALAGQQAMVSESEADSVTIKTPARKASAHVVQTEPSKRYHLRERDGSGKAITADLSAVAAPNEPTEEHPSRKTRNHIVDPFGSDSEITSQAVNAVAAALHSLTHRDVSAINNPSSAPSKIAGHISRHPDGARQPKNSDSIPPEDTPSHFKHATASALVPSSIQPLPGDRALQFQQHVQKTAHPHIEPKTIRSGEDRNWALLMKIITNFYEDRKYLLSPMNLTTHNNDPNGIHVFVDASNIFIGFMEQLKRSRDIPSTVHVPRVHLSFDALALLMERRRPVAKRVLVGSTPHLPAFDKAAAVGYECNILEKVYKARELTERQIYFRDLDERQQTGKHAKAPPNNQVTHVNGYSFLPGSGYGSGSETNAPQYAPAKMIEQGVDEILHLKILESVVDYDEPSTIVLATGDAAQAEYSQGFMAMVERALRKGWNVELVSWSKNISAMYTKRAWVETWGAQFTIIFLDDYAEELLDM